MANNPLPLPQLSSVTLNIEVLSSALANAIRHLATVGGGTPSTHTNTAVGSSQAAPSSSLGLETEARCSSQSPRYDRLV